MASPAPYDSPVRAQDILTRALLDIGAHQRGASLDPDVAAEGLDRLNGMIAGWANQAGTIPFIQRQVFPLVVGKGGPGWPYTIGIGGDFNVYRPMTLSGAGVLLSAVTPQSITGITRVGTVATATTAAAHGYSTGFDVDIFGSNQTQYNGEHTITVTGANTFTFPVTDTPVTPATGTITVRAEALASTSTVEIPRAVITDDMFQFNRVKNLQTLFPTYVYYNQTYAGNLGVVIVWPIPTAADNSLVLYWPAQVPGFADLTTQYAFPAGYAETFEKNLAVRWGPAMGRKAEDYQDVARMAIETLAWIKVTNTKLSDVPQDQAITSDRRGGYNIFSGTGG